MERKSILRIKYEYSIKLGYASWHGLRMFTPNQPEMTTHENNIIESYAAQERAIAVEKALEVASEEAKVVLLVGNCKKECEVVAQLTARVDKQSILSLAPSIIEQLNNEQA